MGQVNLLQEHIPYPLVISSEDLCSDIFWLFEPSKTADEHRSNL